MKYSCCDHCDPWCIGQHNGHEVQCQVALCLRGRRLLVQAGIPAFGG